MAEKLYQSEEWLRREYHGNGRTLTDMADECGVTSTTISDWMERHGIDRRSNREAQKPDKPYTDKEWLKREYLENGRSMSDIGTECDVSPAVILKWLRRFEIETRHSADWKRKEPVSLKDTSRGYVILSSKHNGEIQQCYHHQLLAISEGEDPHKVFSNGDYHVHHKNEIKWDNRPENIELISGSEHLSMHYSEREKTDTGEVI